MWLLEHVKLYSWFALYFFWTNGLYHENRNAQVGLKGRGWELSPFFFFLMGEPGPDGEVLRDQVSANIQDD